ncbi:MAG: hypothetical protein ACI4QT_10000, partial [Kiritimatiellia bacterium]
DAKGYQDIKVSIQFQTGGVGEVIIIDDFMYDGKMKRGGHACYEITRILNKHRTQSKLVDDAWNAVKDLSEAIYAKGDDVLSPEEWERAKANASSSVTRLVDSQDNALLSSRDMKTLKSSLEGLYLATPPSTSSYATPNLSSIKNIDSSASRTNESVSKTVDSGNTKKDEASGPKNEKPERSGAVDVPTRKRKIRTPDGAMETDVTPSFVPASSLIASDNKNYPQQFQPRDRAQSASSKAQIENAANNLDPGTLLQDSRGSETGAPKILPNGVVLSGNGRTMMIRRAHEKKLGTAYDEAVRKKAADMGIELPELKNGDYWVYVEKVDMPEGEAVKFAEHSNKNTILQRSAYEQAEADAKSISEDKEFLGIIGQTENDGSVSIRDSSYFQAVQRFSYVIHAGDEGLLDSRGTPTAAVYDRLENALIASLFRNLPQDEARAAIRAIIERDTTGKGEGMARAFNGVIRAVPSLLSMANSAQGKAGRDITDKVGKALVRYIGMRKSGMKNSEIQAMAEKAQPLPGFGQLGIEDMILAQLAFRAGKNYPVGDFLVEYTFGAMNALTERDMFGQEPPTNETLMANSIRRADEKRESNGAVLVYCSVNN